MKYSAMFRWIVFPGVLAGLVLHTFIWFYLAQGGPIGFTVGFFALSVLPYLACFLVGMRNVRGSVMAACAIPFMLLVDSFAFNEAFIAPTSSTASLVLLVVPVINLAVMLIAFLVGWVAFSLHRRSTVGRAS